MWCSPSDWIQIQHAKAGSFGNTAGFEKGKDWTGRKYGVGLKHGNEIKVPNCVKIGKGPDMIRAIIGLKVNNGQAHQQVKQAETNPPMELL
ncbi:hypothetical protein Tco_0407744 [Tanacetum coccineum]